jgi:hypothetical protein
MVGSQPATRYIELLAKIVGVSLVASLALWMLAFAAKVQVLRISNLTGANVLVEQVTLGCNKFQVGVLEPRDTKTFVFRRCSGGEGSYVITGLGLNGTPFRSAACYIDIFPHLSKLNLTNSTSGLRCQCSEI